MLPSAVEPTGRQMMGAIKRAYNHVNCVATTTGSPNAQTVSYAVAPQALVAGDTFCLLIGNGLSNTAAATLDINGLGAKPIVTAAGTPTVGGELVAGQYTLLVYDGGNFRVETFTNNINGTLFVHGGGITLENSQPLNLKTTGGAAWNAVQLDGSNNLQIGSTNFSGQIQFFNAGAQHAAIDANGSVYSLGGDFHANNGHGLWIKDNGGIDHNQFLLDGSNNLQIGSTLDSGQILFLNAGAQHANLDTLGRFGISGGGAQYFVNGLQISCSNLAGAAASCSTNTTNASNITSGTLPNGRLSGGYSIGNLVVSNSAGGGGGNIGLDNGSNLLAKDTGGNYRIIAQTDGANNLNIGDNNLNAVCFHDIGTNCTSFINTSGQYAFTHGFSGYTTSGPAANGVVLYNSSTIANTWVSAGDDGNVHVLAGSSGNECTYSSGTSWSCGSDARLKDNLTPLDRGALNSVLQLHPVSYNLKTEPPDKTHLGFIAQDVRQVFPQLVTTMPDGMLSLEYTGLIAPLVATVQAQQKQIDNLSRRLDALEAKANAK